MLQNQGIHLSKFVSLTTNTIKYPCIMKKCEVIYTHQNIFGNRTYIYSLLFLKAPLRLRNAPGNAQQQDTMFFFGSVRHCDHETSRSQLRMQLLDNVEKENKKKTRAARELYEIFWLVVSAPLKNISQVGSFPQVGVNIKNVWNHHPVFHQSVGFWYQIKNTHSLKRRV